MAELNLTMFRAYDIRASFGYLMGESGPPKPYEDALRHFSRPDLEANLYSIERLHK